MSTQESFIQLEGKLKCPYMKCKCLRFKSVNEVERDICKHRFMKGYYYCTHHGEEMPVVTPSVFQNEYNRENNFREQFSFYEQMLMDAAGSSNASYVM